MCIVASSAAIAMHICEGLVAMQYSLVPKTASVLLLPVMAGHPVPGSRLLHHSPNRSVFRPQIDQRRASAQEARRRTLMSRFLLRRSGDDSRCVWGPDELKDVHRNSLRSR